MRLCAARFFQPMITTQGPQLGDCSGIKGSIVLDVFLLQFKDILQGSSKLGVWPKHFSGNKVIVFSTWFFVWRNLEHSIWPLLDVFVKLYKI